MTRSRAIGSNTTNNEKSSTKGTNTMADNPTIDDLKAPLLAALGAADLALATVNDLLAELRERAERCPHRRQQPGRREPCAPGQAAGRPARAASRAPRAVHRRRAAHRRRRLRRSGDRSVQRADRARRGCPGAAAQPGRLRRRLGACRGLCRPGGRADPGSSGHRRVADPRGRRACRQAGRHRAAEEDDAAAKKARPRRPPPRRLRPRRPGQEGSRQEGSGQEGHPEVTVGLRCPVGQRKPTTSTPRGPVGRLGVDVWEPPAYA